MMRRIFQLLACASLGVLPAVKATPAFQTSPRASVLLSGGAMMNGDHFADSTLAAMRLHFAGCHRVAMVLHASYPAERDAMEVRMQKAFAHVGVPVAESIHHRDAAGALEMLRTADAIWIGGGETFVLLGELYRTGQLAVIRDRVLAGAPLGGVSAGANVAGLLIGTTNDFPVADVPTRDALAVFPAVINPHHPLPEAKAEFDGRAARIRTYLKFNPDEVVLALGNAAMMRLHAGRITFLAGHAWIYRQAGVQEIKAGEDVTDLLRK
jgi:dipeptidase E